MSRTSARNKKKALVKKIVRKADPAQNMDHPNFKDAVEYAFSCGNQDFYRFKDEREIPAGRYVHIDSYLKEHEIRMSLDVLKGYILAMKDQLGGKSGEVNLMNIAIILHKMEGRTNLAFTVETIERLASVVFFDKSESLTLYDSDYGQKKIQFWRKHDNLAFFLTLPIKDYLGLQDTSETSLRNFIQTQTEILKDLTLIPSKPSEGNISSNGS